MQSTISLTLKYHFNNISISSKQLFNKEKGSKIGTINKKIALLYLIIITKIKSAYNSAVTTTQASFP